MVPWPAHSREGKIWRSALRTIRGKVEHIVVVGDLPDGSLWVRPIRMAIGDIASRAAWMRVLETAGQPVDAVLFSGEATLFAARLFVLSGAFRLAGGITRRHGIVAAEATSKRWQDDGAPLDRAGVGPVQRAMLEGGLGEQRLITDTTDPGRVVVVATT